MNMPRPDCEKLMELTKGVLNGYTLADPIWLVFQWVVNLTDFIILILSCKVIVVASQKMSNLLPHFYRYFPH